MAKRKEQPGGGGASRIVNRRARHDYHVREVVECGIALVGSEVKSVRAGQVKLDEAHAVVRGGEAYLVGMHIAPYAAAAGTLGHDPDRDRKLLLHKRQIAQLEAHARQKGKTLVPLALYFKRGWAKCELGLVEGKKQYDKRETIRKRDHQREMDRAVRRYGR